MSPHNDIWRTLRVFEFRKSIFRWTIFVKPKWITQNGDPAVRHWFVVEISSKIIPFFIDEISIQFQRRFCIGKKKKLTGIRREFTSQYGENFIAQDGDPTDHTIPVHAVEEKISHIFLGTSRDFEFLTKFLIWNMSTKLEWITEDREAPDHPTPSPCWVNKTS